MSFKNVKATTYNTINSTLNVVSKSASTLEVGVTLVEDYLLETLEVRNLHKEERLKLKSNNALRELHLDNADSKNNFIESIIKQEEKLNTLREKVSAETLEKYRDLL